MSTYIGNDVFERVEEAGWRRGLGNLLRGELSGWFRSSRWWKNLLVWLLIVNAMMAMMAFAAEQAAKDGSDGPPLILMYGIFGGMSVAFGVMIIMQRVIVGEKKSGTAAWVLSKPVTRTAFVVSRLIGNSIGILVTAVVIPGILVYVTYGALTPLGWLSPIGFALAVLMFVIHTIFWITLTLMLGTFFESSTVVIAVPIAAYLTFWLVPTLIPALLHVSPLVLTFADPDTMNSLAGSFMLGEPVFSWLPLIVTIVGSVLFVAAAIRRFNRQEF